jgi:XRE family aerobic/anaerobic benzoate catabolism transcriptional regulator
MQLLSELGERITELRRRAGLSRGALAKKSGLSERFLADVETGKANISLARLSELCKALEIPLAAFISSLPGAKKAGNGGKDSHTYSTILQMLADSSGQQLEEIRLWLSQRMDGQPKTIALIGLRGAGKTTIGKKLAARLRRKFYELDELIEKEAGLTLQNIFEVQGEEYYRRLEYEMLLDFLSDSKPVVLATGGGIVSREDTYELLRRHCLTFWLKARPEDHWNRVVQKDPRPVTNYPNAFAQLQLLLQRREPLYALADHVIDTSTLGEKGALSAILKIVRTIRKAGVPARQNAT